VVLRINLDKKSIGRRRPMQILILYYSKGGNTRKVAERIAEGVESVSGAKALLKSTQDVSKDDFVNSAGIIAGSPVYFGAMAWDLKRVFDEYVVVRKKMENKVGAAFATSGDPSGGKETTMMSIVQCLLIYGMIIVGDPMEATGHYGVACVGAPDEKTSENARKLGRRVAELCKRLGS
jgi:NAD(P)H dehydrogenase (quinone)